MATSNEQARKAYEEFEKKVKRTVFLDNLSPKVTSSVLKTALGQFGEVLNVEFIPNYEIPYPIPQCALVEMENSDHAKAVLETMSAYPFLMSEMPRPIRALPASAEMFSDRPSPPDRQITVQWLDPSDPNFAVNMKMKELCKKHKAENLALIKVKLTTKKWFSGLMVPSQHSPILCYDDWHLTCYLYFHLHFAVSSEGGRKACKASR